MGGSRRAAASIRRRPDATALAALVTGLAAIAVYRTTLLPGIGAWDTGEAQVVLPVMGTMHPTGFPAYVILGWIASVVLAPLGSPAFVVSFLSAILTGVAVGMSVLVLRRLDVPLPIAAAVAVSFALTPIVWGIGSAADVHSLHLALVVAVTLGLLRWGALAAQRREHPDDPLPGRRADRAIVLTAAVFGIAVANHALSLLLAPAVGLYVLAVDPGVVRRPRLVLATLIASAGTAAVLYLQLPIRGGPIRAPLVYGHPETWDGFWGIVLGRQFLGDVVGPQPDIGAEVARAIDHAGPLLGPILLLVAAGLVVTAVRHPRYALFSATATLVTMVFAASYANAAIERYYLGPAFFAWTWVAVLAAAAADRLAAVRATDGGPDDEDVAVPLLGRGPRVSASAAVATMIGLVVLVPTLVDLDARWGAADRSREVWAAHWLDQVFDAVAPDAVIVSWWSYSTPLWYGQLVEGRRGDILVVDDRTREDEEMGDVADVIDRFLGARPVYVVRAGTSEIAALAERYAIEAVDRPDNLFRVTNRLEAQP